MPRGAELPVLPGARDLAEHVLVDVALGIATFQRDCVEQVDHLGQERRRGDGEPGVPHVLAIGGTLATEGSEEGEDVVVHHLVHVAGRHVLEEGPAEVLVRKALWVLAFGEDLPLHRLAKAAGLVLFEDLKVIQAPDEEEIGDLFDHLQRVGDAAGPEGVPDLVYLRSYGACEHGLGRARAVVVKTEPRVLNMHKDFP